MEKGRVFFDPTGRRARWLARAIVLGVAVPALIFGLFLYDIWLGEPVTPSQIAADFRAQERQAPEILPPSPSAMTKPSLTTTTGPLNLAFYANWDDNSFPDLKKHLDQIDWLIPDWYSLQGKGMTLVTEIDANVPKLLRNSARAPFVMPLLTNASDTGWDGVGLAALLADPVLRQTRIATLTQSLVAHGFQGVVVQFAGLGPESAAHEIAFLTELAKALHQDHLLLATLRPIATPVDAEIGHISDAVIVQGAPPEISAPIAPAHNVAAQLRAQLAHIPAQKLILTLGNYGRDWSRAGVQDLGFRDVMLRAKDHGVLPQFDAASGSPVLRYVDQGLAHEIWFTDAIAAQNILLALQDVPLAGYALWRLGSEDPTLWHVLPKAGKLLAKPDDFAEIPMAQDVFLTGSGDLLRVTTAPIDGKRQIAATASQWLARYDSLAIPITVNRSGALAGAVSLTFDDGPDRRWTPKILDILAQESAPATFFVTGQNAAFAPDLLQRMIDEGHELGNHSFTHPNLAMASDTAAILEINGTQRLVEASVGRRMRMFRAPYVGDSEPSTPAEIRPLLLAQERGLYIVSLRADSHDWKQVTADQIVASVLTEVGTPSDQKSQTILFHDAGGNRAATVAALPRVIRALRARGFRIVPTAEFAGETVTSIQPEVPKWTFSRIIASMFFTGLRLASALAATLFYVAIGLGLVRLGFISIFGILQARKDPAHAPPPQLDDLVTILIPAYNEEKVIQSCLAHVLGGRHHNIEVVVINDGSTDDTAKVVAQMAARDHRITLFTIPNGGKANALNFGLRHSRAEVVVALDADTQFLPDTISRLLRWFIDPKVMAVAGNAKVGNRVNYLTRCQALEYITAQNLERRAYAKLGCITVVPGAVGAWRRSAVQAAGGFPDDTLAEDQDLTLALHLQGGKILYDPTAIAQTEAPDTLSGLMKQRFRWSFGTLQCLWKHNATAGQPRKIAWFVLPQILLFQVVFAVIAPIIDLSLILRLMLFASDALQHGGDVDSEALRLTLLFFCVFLCAELLAGLVAIVLDRGESVKLLFLLVPQRFGYRQLLCLITLRAVMIAAAGRFVGWGHLERRATVSMDLG